MAGTQTNKDATARAPAHLHDTRQLLDELDALMDQMLALPIDDREGGEESAGPSSSPNPTVTATLTLLAPAAPAGSGQWAVDSEEKAGAPALPTVHCPLLAASMADEAALAGKANGNVATDELTAPAPVMTDVAAPPVVELLAPPPPVGSARWRPDQLSYQFLLWVNQGYDRGTARLGKLGQLLRSRFVRALLGIAGLGLLAWALAWLVRDWLGWNW